MRKAIRPCAGLPSSGWLFEEFFDPVNDMGRAEGFGHVLIRTDHQSFLAIRFLALCGQDDHVGAFQDRVLSQPLTDDSNNWKMP